MVQIVACAGAFKPSHAVLRGQGSNQLGVRQRQAAAHAVQLLVLVRTVDFKLSPVDQPPVRALLGQHQVAVAQQSKVEAHVVSKISAKVEPLGYVHAIRALPEVAVRHARRIASLVIRHAAASVCNGGNVSRRDTADCQLVGGTRIAQQTFVLDIAVGVISRRIAVIGVNRSRRKLVKPVETVRAKPLRRSRKAGIAVDKRSKRDVYAICIGQGMLDRNCAGHIDCFAGIRVLQSVSIHVHPHAVAKGHLRG